MKNKENTENLRDTLKTLQEALETWNDIPDGAESEMEQFRKKTRDLVKQINRQIEILGL